MIPSFPEFKKVEMSDGKLIEHFTARFPPYNDFEFTSLWSYNIDGKNAFSFYNNNLIIRIHDFVTGEYFYSFLGINKIKDTITSLLEQSREDHFNPQLKLVPEIAILSTSEIGKYFLVMEDPDNFDYILSVKEIADFSGSKYQDKRNLVNRFKKGYPDHKIIQLDLTDLTTQREILNLFALWQKLKERQRDDSIIELTALERLFELSKFTKFQCLGVYSSSRLIGFSTFHTIWDGYAILSFEKCDVSFKGIYEYLNQETAKYLQILGAKYINYEQDLGIPGLKKAKMLWRPVFFLKKYTIEPLH